VGIHHRLGLPSVLQGIPDWHALHRDNRLGRDLSLRDGLSMTPGSPLVRSGFCGHRSIGANAGLANAGPASTLPLRGGLHTQP
jgi:hypothetical protein